MDMYECSRKHKSNDNVAASKNGSPITGDSSSWGISCSYLRTIHESAWHTLLEIMQRRIEAIKRFLSLAHDDLEILHRHDEFRLG